jgi:sugar lactone lactonase YvrE
VALDVYPVPQDEPLMVVFGEPSSLISIAERVGLDPITAENRMYIRAAFRVLGDLAATGPPHPTIRLRAGTGSAVDIQGPPAEVAIYDRPGAAAPVATAILTTEADNIYLVEVSLFQTSDDWRIQFVNNDEFGAHSVTWVVADEEPQTRQPWIDVPTTLEFDAVIGQVTSETISIANLGTGVLEIANTDGTDLGAGFALDTVVPRTVHPKSRATAVITFSSSTAGSQSSIIRLTSNDSGARPSPGHNAEVSLSARVRKPLWAAGDILVTDSDDSPEGTLIKVDAKTGKTTMLSSGDMLLSPVGVTVESDGNILILDTAAFGNAGGVIRLDRLTGSQTMVSSGGLLVSPSGLAAEPDGKFVVADFGTDGNAGAVIRVDPATNVQTRLSSGEHFMNPRGVAIDGDDVIVVSRDDLSGPGLVVRVDRTTGKETVVSSGGIFEDPGCRPRGVAVESGGSILILATHGPSVDVTRVAPGGEQTWVAGGKAFGNVFGVAVEDDGNIVVTRGATVRGGMKAAVVRLDPVSRDQTEVALRGLLRNPLGIAVVPANV